MRVNLSLSKYSSFAKGAAHIVWTTCRPIIHLKIFFLQELCLCNLRILRKKRWLKIKGKKHKEKTEKEEQGDKMDIYNSNGLSWADQWDPEPIPSETRDGKKEKGGSDKSKGKKLLNLKWVKNICKKSKNDSNKV